MSGRVVHRRELSDILAQHSEEIAELQRQTRMPGSSLKEGTISILDADEEVRLLIGKLPDGNYGLRLVAPNGDVPLQLDVAGWRAPYQPIPHVTNSPAIDALINQSDYTTNRLTNGGYYGDGLIGGEQFVSGYSFIYPGSGSYSMRMSIESSDDPGNIVSLASVTGITSTSASFLFGDVTSFMGQYCRVYLEGRRDSGAANGSYRIIQPMLVRPTP